jgi:hypothetical protein
MTETNTKKGLITKILFIIGIIVLVLIFAFAVIKIVPRIFTGLASVGQFIASPFSSNAIKVSSNDSELLSGEKFILSWKYTPKEDGNYNFLYDCQENLNLQIISKDGPKNLLCNTPYNLREVQTAELVAVLKKENVYVDFPVTIEYIDSESKNVLASGEIQLSVKNETEDDGNAIIVAEPVTDNSIDINEPAPTNSGPNNGSTNNPVVRPATPVYYGAADLAITNAYTLNDNTITFTISNIGGQATGLWYFEYTSPNGRVNSSPTQLSLNRGQGIKYTLNFDDDTDGTVRISVDPRNSIYEQNESNNYDSIVINGNNNSSNDDDDYNRNDDADLKVTEFEVGRLSGSRFTEDDEIDDNDEAAVRFTVKNIGGESTGSWRYELTNLPYNDDDDSEESRDQSSLRPGESREFTVSFDNIDRGNYTIKVKVDSDDDVDEESESNNTKSDRLEVTN